LKGNGEKMSNWSIKKLYLLSVDLFGCNKKLLNNCDNLKRIIDELIFLLDMVKLADWKIVKAVDKDGDYGYTILVPITESAITMHTFNKRGQVSVVVHTCKEFNKKIVISYLRNVFNAKMIKNKLIKNF